jgi:hypothetical protein
LEASADHKLSVSDGVKVGFPDKKSVEADTKYIEVPLVAEKFLRARNGTDQGRQHGNTAFLKLSTSI